jgi:hypothetical protein
MRQRVPCSSCIIAVFLSVGEIAILTVEKQQQLFVRLRIAIYTGIKQKVEAVP